MKKEQMAQAMPGVIYLAANTGKRNETNLFYKTHCT